MMNRKINAKRKTDTGSHLDDLLVLSGTQDAPAAPAFPAVHDFSRIAIHAASARQIQAQPEVSQPEDSSEQEAEQVVRWVMQASPKSSQTIPVTASSPTMTSDDGQLLDENIRDFMEPRFGHDFSKV